MKKCNPDARKRTDPRPAYIKLGDDTDETIHVVQDSERVQKFVLNGRSVEDYVKFAALVDQLVDATEVPA